MSITNLSQSISRHLMPAAYWDYLAQGRPLQGRLRIDPLAFELWPVDELIELNEAYGIEEHLPGFFAFGTDGGDEVLAFDPKHAVFMVPIIGMDRDAAHLVADSWDDLVEQIIAP